MVLCTWNSLPGRECFLTSMCQLSTSIYGDSPSDTTWLVWNMAAKGLNECFIYKKVNMLDGLKWPNVLLDSELGLYWLRQWFAPSSMPSHYLSIFSIGLEGTNCSVIWYIMMMMSLHFHNIIHKDTYHLPEGSVCWILLNQISEISAFSKIQNNGRVFVVFLIHSLFFWMNTGLRLSIQQCFIMVTSCEHLGIPNHQQMGIYSPKTIKASKLCLTFLCEKITSNAESMMSWFYFSFVWGEYLKDALNITQFYKSTTALLLTIMKSIKTKVPVSK